MKTAFTFFLGALFSIASFTVSAQGLAARAETQTREMASKLNLNEADFVKLKKANLNRMEKIESLSALREQDHRYLDLRLDQIEEEYNAELFGMLKPTQYAAFVDYKKDQPYTYAGVISDTKTKAIAIQNED